MANGTLIPLSPLIESILNVDEKLTKAKGMIYYIEIIPTLAGASSICVIYCNGMEEIEYHY